MVGTDANINVLEADVTLQGTVKNGRYNPTDFSSYFTGNIIEVPDKEFEALYGDRISDGSWRGENGINDAICQLYYSKGLLTRLVYHVLTKMLKDSEKKSEPNLDIMFIYNMPIRGISKMTAGAINMDMVYAITEIANGHALRGIGRFIKGLLHK